MTVAPRLGRGLSGSVRDSGFVITGKLFPFPGPQVLVPTVRARAPAWALVRGVPDAKKRKEQPLGIKVCEEP